MGDDGVRYFSAPLGMPNERKVRLSTVACGDFPGQWKCGEFPMADPQISGAGRKGPTPLLIWDINDGFPSQRYEAGWSGFYQAHPRKPNEVTILPTYVAQNYTWDEKAYGPKDSVSGWDGRAPAWSFGPAWTFKPEPRIAHLPR